MGYYFYKQDVIQNIVIDTRTGAKVIAKSEYSNKQEIAASEYILKSYYEPIAAFFKGRDQSGKEEISIDLYGEGNSSADRGKAKPAPGSELIDVAPLFAAMEVFKDMPSEEFSAEVQDFFKGEKGRKILERLVNLTKAAKAASAANNVIESQIPEDINSKTNFNNTEGQKKNNSAVP